VADNTTLNPGTGGDVIVTEQPGGAGPKIPVSKIYTGALDVNGGPVTSTNPLDVRISDATNTASVKAASTAAVATDKAVVVAISPNNTVPVSLATGVAQGTAAAVAGAWPVKLTDGTNTMPAGDVAARAGFEKITDGTNTAAVKAASTAATVADSALVVSFSPNSPGKFYQSAPTATQSQIAGIATTTTLIASNTARKGATIFNDSTSVLYVKLGATASTISFTVKLQAGDYYEVPFGYTGIIDGIWTTATGAARMTEIT
jgi:hypothetical protein